MLVQVDLIPTLLSTFYRCACINVGRYVHEKWSDIAFGSQFPYWCIPKGDDIALEDIVMIFLFDKLDQNAQVAHKQKMKNLMKQITRYAQKSITIVYHVNSSIQQWSIV